MTQEPTNIHQHQDQIGLEQGEQEEMREDRRTELRLHKNRDGIVGNFNLYWKPDTMEFGPYDETRLLKSRMEDFLPDNEDKTSDFYMNLVTQVK